ncbi:MAG: hypothetical protein HZA67_03685 [Rhodospirillales bacterium]|nr:hypothetical protein [Rhodospirillales bacterium]
MVPGTVLAADSGKWEGWIVGKSCVEELHIVDCPLSLIGEPVLLLENGGHVAFHYGDATAVKHTDIDAAYGRKVRLLGEMKDGAVVPVRMEMLETVGEKKFFKGCL